MNKVIAKNLHAGLCPNLLTTITHKTDSMFLPQDLQ